MTLEKSGLVTVYPNEVPYDTDILRTNLYALTGDSGLSATMLGVGTNYSTKVRGFPCTPIAPPGLSVLVGSTQTPDIIYALSPLNATAYGSLPVDTTPSDYQYKQGFNWGQKTFSTPAPTTTGNTVIHLVQVAFVTQDLNNVSRPYYNSTDPSMPIFMNNYDTRQNVALLGLKQGVEAISPTPPTPDPGYIGLYYVTVTFGQTSIISGNIAKVSTTEGQPFITEDLTQKVSSGQLGNYVTKQQLQDTQFVYAIAGGTANAITAAPTPSYVAGGFNRIAVLAQLDNTSAVTLNISGTGAIEVRRISPSGLIPLVSGDIKAGSWLDIYYDGLYYQLLNPTAITPYDFRNFTYMFAVDSGTPNNVVITAPAGWSLDGNTQLWVFIENDNTGPTTITISGNPYTIAKKSPVGGSAVPLTGGELVSASFCQLIWDGLFFEVQNPRDYIDYEQQRNMDVITAIDTGTVNNIVANPTRPYLSYTGFTHIWVFIENTNTGASTLNISGLGAAAITKPSPGGAPIPLTGGELVAANWSLFIHNGTNFQLINQTADYDGTDSYAVDSSGSANTLIATPPVQYYALVSGVSIKVKSAHTNTGASTLQILPFAAKNIQKITNLGLVNVQAANIVNGGIYEFVYDSVTDIFQILNPTL